MSAGVGNVIDLIAERKLLVEITKNLVVNADIHLLQYIIVNCSYDEQLI